MQQAFLLSTLLLGMLCLSSALPSSSWYTSNQTCTIYSMYQPLTTTGNCGILNAYPAWVTTKGQRVVAPNSALPSVLASPADPWTLIASSWLAGYPSSAGTSGCFICLRLYADPSAYANYTGRELFPQPYVQGYVHDSESNNVIAVDDGQWYVNTPGVWRAVDCPVGNNKVYYQSSCSQSGGFTKLWVLGATIPITAVSISTDGTNWLATTQNTNDAGWIEKTVHWSTTTFPQTVHIKMTSMLGQVLTDTFQWTGFNAGSGCGTGSMLPDGVAIPGMGNVQFNGFTTTITPTTSSSGSASGSASGGTSTGSAGSLRWNLPLVFAMGCVVAFLMLFM